MMRLAILSALGIGLLLSGSAGAQITLMNTGEDTHVWEYRADFTTLYQTRTAITGGGSIDTLEYELGIRGGGPMSEDLRVFLDASYRHREYDFGSATTAACSNPAACFRNDPWRDVHRLDLVIGAGLTINESFEVQLLAPMRWNAETHSEKNAMTAGAVALLQWRSTDRLTAGIGLGVQNELEEDLSIFPALSLDWQMSDQLRLITRGGPYQGGEVALLWTPSDVFQGSLSGGYERSRFRLDNRSPNIKGVGESTSAPLLVRMDLAMNPQLHFFVEGGVAVAGQLRIDDARGNRLSREDFDSAGIIRGSCRLYF